MPRSLAHEDYSGVTLTCGHKATGHAVAIYPGGKRLYRCKPCGKLVPRKKGKTR